MGKIEMMLRYLLELQLNRFKNRIKNVHKNTVETTRAKCDKHFTNKYCFENKLKATENGFYHSGQGWYLSKPAVLKQGDMTRRKYRVLQVK